MSYLGRDIEDAIGLGILQREEVPKTLLGTTNREILGFLAADIIRNSYDKEYIGISNNAYEALLVLRRFNFQHIYIHPKLKIESSRIKYSYRLLFEYLLSNLKEQNEQSYLWKNFLHKRSENYLSHTNAVQMVIDYVAGMTDNFLCVHWKKSLFPQKFK